MTKEYVRMNIKDIQPYINNARKNDGAVEAVAESIRQCGYVAPIIVDEDNIILAGHTRWKALKKLHKSDCEVLKITGLTTEQKKKYRLLDNKTNELAEWDYDLLTKELEGLSFDGFDFGFDMPNLDELGEVVEDEAPEVEEDKPAISKLGDIWQLGRHRVMCGDSTDEECVKRLTGGRQWTCCSQTHLMASTMLAKLRTLLRLRTMPRTTRSSQTSSLMPLTLPTA